jgi:hypothetical protein
MPGGGLHVSEMFVLPPDRPHGEPHHVQNANSIIESLFWSAVICVLLLAVGCSVEGLDIRRDTSIPFIRGSMIADNNGHIVGR